MIKIDCDDIDKPKMATPIRNCHFAHYVWAHVVVVVVVKLIPYLIFAH